MVNVGRGALEKSFLNHTRLAKQGSTPSHRLVQFYAIECGLKSMILRQKGALTSKNIDRQLFGNETFFDHNLVLLAKMVGLPASVFGNCEVFRIGKNPDRRSTLNLHSAHLAWRYGIIINSEDEAIIIKAFENVGKLIERELMR